MQIQKKIFLSILLSSITIVVIFFVFMQWSLDRGMLDYINKREQQQLKLFASSLSERYALEDGWQWVKNKPRVLRAELFNHIEGQDRHHDDLIESDKDFRKGKRPSKRRLDMAILALDGSHIVGNQFTNKKHHTIPISLDDKPIGWLYVAKRHKITDGFELSFIEQQRKALIIMSLAILLVSAVIAIPLSRHLVKPVLQLTRAAKQLTHGDYSITLSTQRNDELGQLTRDFNELAKTLKENETVRQRWVADISHELRTPIAILSGEIEAMLDGVRPISPAGINSIHEEVQHLTKLVNDLHELSLADIGGLQYKKANIDLIELISSKLSHYQAVFDQHKLTANFYPQQQQLTFWADGTRFNQLFDNLLTNAYRYTDEGGEVHVSITMNRQYMTIVVEDSAPSVSDQALSKLFDYLYSFDQSRNRLSSGSGLGLAICQRIVEAHSGKIEATQSSLGGVAITMIFPILTHD